MIKLLNGKLSINDKLIELKYPVIDAFESGGTVIALFDPDAYTEKFGQFPNLVALQTNGVQIWVAELPTTNTGDCYYKIASKMPLVVYSVCSEECEIEVATGRIKTRSFYK
jgi:hypothetical protein